MKRTLRRATVLGASALLIFGASAAPAFASSAKGLRGVITDSATHEPIGDATVIAYTISPVDHGQAMVEVERTTTDNAGAYSLSDLAPGTYHLELQAADYVDEYAHNSTDPFNSLAIAAPGTFNEDLQPASTVHGHLVDEHGKNVTSGTVQAYSPYNPAFSPNSVSIADGSWEMTGLPPGKYTFEFFVEGHANQYAHGTFFSSKASKIALHVGDNTVDDTLLPMPTGVINGTATDKGTGKPLSHICFDVEAEVPPTEGTSGICTTAQGTFHLSGLASEKVTLSASDATGRYVTSGWVTVRAVDGSVVAANLRFARGGAITGMTVDATTGEPVAATGQMCIQARSATLMAGIESTCALETRPGHFSIAQLPAGDYHLKITSGGGPYGVGWVASDGSGTTDSSQAGVFHVVAGKALSVPNVKLYAPGTITGTATDKATGKPVKNVCVGVGVYDPREPGWDDNLGACTDANGHYSLSGLEPGQWTVEFVPNSPYNWSFSGGAATRLSASKVRVDTGHVSRANIQLTTGGTGTITGSIRNASGVPVRDYSVFVFNAQTADWAQTYDSASAKGKYTVAGIVPQAVKIRYQIGTGPELWYGGTSFATAKAVTITQGTTTIDLQGH